MLLRKHSAILLTFIKLPFFIKIFVLSIFEWSFYTCSSVCMPQLHPVVAVVVVVISNLIG